MVVFLFQLMNLLVPDKKDAIIDKAEKEVQKVEKLYMDGVITNGERYNKVIRYGLMQRQMLQLRCKRS